MIRSMISVALAQILFVSLAGAADAPTKDIAARAELLAIQTLTLSDQQFLIGASDGKPTVIAGQLRIARGAGRLPVVVLMHGSGGMGPNIEMWSRELNAIGISTLALDGFSGRGLVQVSTDQAKLGRLNFILDIYRGLDLLANHPRVDPARIAVMGFSRGGQAALYASLTRFQKMWNKSGIDIAGYIPFYPDCATTFLGDTEIGKPIRIFHGTPDDYNPVATCKAYVARLKSAGRDVELTEFPNAPHAFDNPHGARPPVAGARSQSVRNCDIRENAGGVLVNSATKTAFSYADSCVALGPHTGHDPEATAQAKQAVKEFVRTLFKLN